MSKKKKEVDLKLYATIENAHKCLDNADRLFNDALKTSPPTEVALLELAVEELSKGIVLIFNMTDKLQNNELKELVPYEWPKDLLQQLQEKEVMDFLKPRDLSNHNEKLNVLKKLFDSILSFYQNPSYRTIFEPIFQIIPKEISLVNVKGPTEVDISEILKNLKNDNWEKVKECAFYVDFEDQRVIVPVEQDFKVYFSEIFKVFVIIRTALSLYTSLGEGRTIKDMLSDQKTLLGPLYDIIETGRNKMKELKTGNFDESMRGD
jgi:hypothetical protein